MDPIILRGDPFDGNENTSQEDRRVRASFIKTKKRENTAEGKTVMQIVPTLLDVARCGDPVHPFTCYVQELLAKTVFRGNIPEDGPDKERDTPEMYRDKTLFHRAVTGARQFREQTLEPLLQRLTLELQPLLDEAFWDALHARPKLVVHNKQDKKNVSDWSSAAGAEVRLEWLPYSSDEQPFSMYATRAEAEYIKALHNVFHLEKYVIAILLDGLRNAKNMPENYTDAWILLATPDYASKAIADWEELTFIPFVDYMLGLWMTLRYFEKQ